MATLFGTPLLTAEDEQFLALPPSPIASVGEASSSSSSRRRRADRPASRGVHGNKRPHGSGMGEGIRRRENAGVNSNRPDAPAAEEPSATAPRQLQQRLGRPIQPPRRHDGGEGYDRSEPGEVVCEVTDLYYGIELPPLAAVPAPSSAEQQRSSTSAGAAAPSKGNRQGRYGSALLNNVFRKGGSSSRGGAESSGAISLLEKRKRVLVNGVNCRFCAGEMVAVIGASGAGKSTFLDLLAGKKAEGECAGQIRLKRASPAADGGGGGSGSGEGTGGCFAGGGGGGSGGRASVYVTQDDFHVAELTVRESLAFAVRLAMGGRGVRERDRRARVNELLEVLGLEACSEVRVGNPLERGISGGEARRLSMGIGVAALESVRLLLLDEPTTGLDSSSAAEVMVLARRLASRGDRRAVVASVHQPSAEMFSLFDKVLVLVDGRQAFFGSPSQAVISLSRPDLGIIPSPGQNAAEFILLAARAAVTAATKEEAAGGRRSGGGGGVGRRSGVNSPPSALSPRQSPGLSYSSSPGSPSAGQKRLVGVDPATVLGDTGVGVSGINGDDGVTMIGDYLYEEAEEGVYNEGPVVAGRGEGHGSGWGWAGQGAGGERRGDGGYQSEDDGDTQELLQRPKWGIIGGGGGAGGERGPYAVGFWAQVAAVWWRGWTVQARRKDALWALLVKNSFIGLLAATVFWQEGAVKRDDPLVDTLMKDVTPAASNVLGILYFGTLYGLTGHLQAIPEIFEWKRHFERERAAGMYSTTVFWLVSSFVHVPVILGGFTVYLNVCYYSVGFTPEYSKFFVFAGIGLMSTLMGYSVAQTLSSAMATPRSAFATWPLVFVTAANFSGFTVRLPVVHPWFHWLCKVSFCRWIYQLMVVNQFGDYDEGPELLDLYFGPDRPSLGVNAVYVGLCYVVSLLLSLFFLQPNRSRLRVLKENPVLASAQQREEEEQEFQRLLNSPSRRGQGGGALFTLEQHSYSPELGQERWRHEESKSSRGEGLRSRRSSADDSSVVFAAFDGGVCGGLGGRDGDGPIYYIDDDVKGSPTAPSVSTITTTPLLGGGGGGANTGNPADYASSLRVPLLEGFDVEHGNMAGVSEAGVSQGSRVSFSNLHYHIFLGEENVAASTAAAGSSSTTATIANGASTSTSGSINDPSGAAGKPDAANPAVSKQLPGNDKEAHVLKGISGVVSPGQMMAILGPSGSGKTTLLDLLGGRKTGSVGRQEGEIVVDGVLGREGGVGNRGAGGSAYVMQDNVHHASLTVRQTLAFAAKLRMSSTTTAKDREKRIAAMVTMLGLGGILDTIVGGESKRGISGGEAKRLSVAVEAMDLPGLLLLDEPTSGLDATTALEVLTAVRGLANLGRTVVLSLHQPSQEMFELLDTCLLLGRGGYQAYYGKADRAMEYFASIGLTPPPSSSSIAEQNPADFLLSLLASSTSSSPLAPSSGASSAGTMASSATTSDDDASRDDDPPSSLSSAASSPSRFGTGVEILMPPNTTTDRGGGGGGGVRGLSPLLEVDLGAAAAAGGGGGGGGGGRSAAVGPARDRDLPPPAYSTGIGVGVAAAAAAAAASSPVGQDGGRGDNTRVVTPAELGRLFRQSPESVETREEAERDAAEAVARSGDGGSSGWWRWLAACGGRGGGGDKKNSTLYLSAVLTHRELTTTWQDRAHIFPAIGRHAFVGSFYGTLWWQLGMGRVYERVGVIFFSLVFVMLSNQQNIPRIFQDRLLFYREKGAGVYGPVEYWWSIVIAQVPLAVINAAAYGTIVYNMSGLNHNSWEPFGYFLLVIVLCNLVALSFCQMLAAATRLQDTAVSLFPVFLFFFIAFGGFIVRIPTLPAYLRSWAPTISFVRWAMEGLVINEFEGNEEAIFPRPEGIPVTPEEIYETFLEAYGFGQRGDRTDILGNVLWILVASLVVFRVLTLLCLKFVTFERR